MPKKGREIKNKAEAGVEEPLLGHGEGSIDGERRSNGTELVVDPRPSNQGATIANRHDGHYPEHSGGAH